MFEKNADGVAAVAVARLGAALDDLLALDLTTLHRQELLDLTRDVERQARRMPAFDHGLLAEVDARNTAGDLALRDTAALLRDLLFLTPGEAKARVAAARDLGPRREFTGAPLPLLFPAVSAAQRRGAISPAHARVIVSTLHALPAEIDHLHGRQVEAFLVEHAERLDPIGLATLAERLRDTLDPDGRAPSDKEHERRRSVRLRKNADGSGEIDGHLTAAALVTWQTVLDALSKPQPAEDGEPDPRTAAQRTHDAFLDAGQRLLRSGTLPDSGGTPVTILITMTAAQLEAGTGLASTAHGGVISVAELLSLAAEADIVPAVLNDSGGVLAYGRTRRLASAAQRLALAARDGGCSFPGCDAPPSWCQAHHVVSWLDGGLTDVSNMTLVCGFHHREFERRGWRCQMEDDCPHWLAPAWLDPAQRPRRNTAHHPALTFEPVCDVTDLPTDSGTGLSSGRELVHSP